MRPPRDGALRAAPAARNAGRGLRPRGAELERAQRGELPGRAGCPSTGRTSCSALLVYNDIDLTAGVTGTGNSTTAFSPELRDRGSGAPSAALPFRFGVARPNLLSSGLGEESHRLWRSAFAAWRRLEVVLERAGGRLLLWVVAGEDPLFDELVRHHHAASGLRCPLILTGPRRHHLPHDPHPDRRGHAAIAGHYLRVLAALGWLDLDLESAPPLAPWLDLATAHPPRPELIRALQERAARRLPEELDFDRLTADAVRGFLGGVFPRAGGDRAGARPRRASCCAGKKAGATSPWRSRCRRARSCSRSGSSCGRRAARPRSYASTAPTRRAGTRSGPRSPRPVVEVALETRSYWCEITDPTMKSYRLLAAVQR